MSCSQDDRSTESLSSIGFNAHHLFLLDDDGIHASFEMHLTTTFQNGVSHVLDDTRELVRTDMRMGIHEDGSACSMLAEHIQNLVHIATLLASGVKFTIRVGTGTPFTKAIVAFRVHLVLATDLGNVHLSFADILASFHHNRAETMLNQAKSSKQSTRTCTHHDDLRFSFHILISGTDEFLVLWKLVDVHSHFQVHEDGALACVDASFQYTDGLDGPCIESLVLADE